MILLWQRVPAKDLPPLMFHTLCRSHEGDTKKPPRTTSEKAVGNAGVTTPAKKPQPSLQPKVHARLLGHCKHNSSAYHWATAACSSWSVHHTGA